MGGQRPFRLAGPWSGTRPRPALTFRSDTRPWARLGVCLRDVCSRVKLFLPLCAGQAVMLVS
jgi:hypothetical protein